MVFNLKCFIVILLVGCIAGIRILSKAQTSDTDNNSECLSTNYDESSCSELISTASSKILDQVMDIQVSDLNRASQYMAAAPFGFVRQTFQPNPANLTNSESFAKSFYLIIFNPGGKEGRNVSLTKVLEDCSVLELSGTSTKLVWSGYSNDYKGASSSHIYLGFSPPQMQEYADASDATIIVVDWQASGLSQYGLYQIVFCLFDQMDDLFTHWLTECVDIETLDMIGHSVGAQMIGYIGQHLKAAGKTARALIGLDPALPAFGPTESRRCEGVQDGAAKYVAVYHCSPGTYGTDNFNIGDASYLINAQCDFRQVGCGHLDSPCDHSYCHTIFLKLTQNDTITATRTDNPSNCPGSETIDVTVYEYTQNGYFCVNTYEDGQCPSSN